MHAFEYMFYQITKYIESGKWTGETSDIFSISDHTP